jgi:hypothetical protein
LSGTAESALLRYELTARRESICYMSWTIDAYEGVGFLRTDDPGSGLVSILFPSDWRDEIERVVDALESEGVVLERRGVSPENGEHIKSILEDW